MRPGRKLGGTGPVTDGSRWARKRSNLMETRANYAIVGFFTLLVMLSAFGFVYWMARYGGTGETSAA
jgi:uncharacterized membrane protein AbrB (regulator of aidB expression)